MSMLRALVLIHRYVGATVGVLMATWCLSGIVMIYSPYPMLMRADRLVALQPLNFNRCCAWPNDVTPDDAIPVGRFDIEMLAGVPILRLSLESGARRLVDLQSGATLGAVDDARALDVVERYATSHRLSVAAASHAHIQHDQWTVGGFAADRPLHKVRLQDAAGTELYVSSLTGKLIQRTTQQERLFGWIGAVPHWLYPSVLRGRPAVWTQVVIWTSVTGAFLTAVGLFLGICSLRRNRTTGQFSSPYRGIMYWHHVPGLLFGLFALTWVVSGLFTMNPWGLFETVSARSDAVYLQGALPTMREVRAFIDSISKEHPDKFVTFESVPLDGRLFVIGTTADGARQRFDGSGHEAPLQADEVHAAAARLAGPRAKIERLDHEDAYHYSVMRQVAVLPVFRVTGRGADPTYFYLDATSAALLDKADTASKRARWWESGLHRLDFLPFLRTPLARTLIMLPLLLGATIVSVIGAYVGIRRLSRLVTSS